MRASFRLDKKSPVSLHQQLHDIVFARIRAGELADGERLPSEHTLCRAAGVSRITVRHALAALVREGLCASRQGAGTFVAHRAAAMAGGSAATINVLLHTAIGSFMNLLLAGIERGLRGHGYAMTVRICDNDPAREAAYLDAALRDGSTKGVIVSPTIGVDDQHPNCRRFLQLKDAGVPVLFADIYVPALSIGHVVCDDRGGTRELTEHLIRLGRDRIGYLNRRENTTVLLARYEGFRDAMMSHHLVIRPDWVRAPADGADEMADDIQRGAAVARQVVSSRVELPSAWVACNASVAIGACQVLKQAGWRIPHDVAVVAVGDVPEAAHIEPPLTVMRMPVEGMGERTAGELLKAIKNGDTAENVRVILGGELVVRGSCGADLRKSPARGRKRR